MLGRTRALTRKRPGKATVRNKEQNGEEFPIGGKSPHSAVVLKIRGRWLTSPATVAEPHFPRFAGVAVTR